MNHKVRVAWKVVGSVFAVTMLLFGGLQAVSALAHEEHVEVVEEPAAGLARVEVRNHAGRVRVVGVPDADTVRVTAHVSDGLLATRYGVERDGDRLVVRASCPTLSSQWCSVNHTIEVPADMAVTVRSDGRVSVEGTAGPLDVRTDAGRVDLTDVGGTVVARVDSGRIEGSGLTAADVSARTDAGRVQLGFAASPERVEARSDVGSVTVLLPDEAGVAYALDANSGLGSVTTAIRTDPASANRIVARSEVGSITVRYAEG